MSEKKASQPAADSGTPFGNGILFVITAPSGTGKSSLCWAAIEHVDNLAFSVSHTTRPPRINEKEGRDYYFVDENTFKRMVSKDEFLEWAVVYDRYYGTSKAEIERARRRGVDLLIEIDRQGARQIREKLPDAVGIIIVPPSLEVLRERLKERGTESEEEIERRLAIAADELSEFPHFEYAVINDNFELATRRIVHIIHAERLKVKHQKDKLEKIVKGKPLKQAAD